MVASFLREISFMRVVTYYTISNIFFLCHRSVSWVKLIGNSSTRFLFTRKSVMPMRCTYNYLLIEFSFIYSHIQCCSSRLKVPPATTEPCSKPPGLRAPWWRMAPHTCSRRHTPRPWTLNPPCKLGKINQEKPRPEMHILITSSSNAYSSITASELVELMKDSHQTDCVYLASIILSEKRLCY